MTIEVIDVVGLGTPIDVIDVIGMGPQGPPGIQGATGPAGETGPAGPAGPGVPVGGTAGQVLSKIDATDFNTQWSAGGGSGASITVSDTAPASPAPGALWWNSAVGVGQLFVYYADPNSSQWVIANQGVPGPPGLYQAGPGLSINPATSPPTIDVFTPYAPLNSPGLTGTPTAPTAATATNTTQLATTAFVKAQGPYVVKAGDTMTGGLTVNLNTAPLQSAAGSQLHVGGANGSAALFMLDGYGAVPVALVTRLARGTAAAPAPPQGGDWLLDLQGQGWVTSGYSDAASIRFEARQNWAAGALGTHITLNTIPNGSAAPRTSVLVADGLMVGGTIANDPGAGSIIATGQIRSMGNAVVDGVFYTDGLASHHGRGGAYQGNFFNFEWIGYPNLWVDNVLVGTISTTCDYRIKENVVDLPSTWDKVKALRPISYTTAENAELLTVANDSERWGFLAHELQATLLESAATGYKDVPNQIQSLDLIAVIASLTKALQEAMARIEVLESRA